MPFTTVPKFYLALRSTLLCVIDFFGTEPSVSLKEVRFQGDFSGNEFLGKKPSYILGLGNDVQLSKLEAKLEREGMRWQITEILNDLLTLETGIKILNLLLERMLYIPDRQLTDLPFVFCSDMQIPIKKEDEIKLFNIPKVKDHEEYKNHIEIVVEKTAPKMFCIAIFSKDQSEKETLESFLKQTIFQLLDKLDDDLRYLFGAFCQASAWDVSDQYLVFTHKDGVSKQTIEIAKMVNQLLPKDAQLEIMMQEEKKNSWLLLMPKAAVQYLMFNPSNQTEALAKFPSSLTSQIEHQKKLTM